MLLIHSTGLLFQMALPNPNSLRDSVDSITLRAGCTEIRNSPSLTFTKPSNVGKPRTGHKMAAGDELAVNLTGVDLLDAYGLSLGWYAG